MKIQVLKDGPVVDVTDNAFCPTGKGGGKDPTCSPGGYGRGEASSMSLSVFKKASSPAGKVQMHGMEKSEAMRSVTVDGVDILFTPKTAAAAHQTVMNSKEVHPALWKQNKKIVFTEQSDKEESKIAKIDGHSEFKSAASGGDGNLVVYGSRPMDVQTLAHESAHNLAFNTWGDANLPLMDKRGKLIKNDFASDQKITLQGTRRRVSNSVTEYGSNSRAEDFAEFMTAYNEIHVRGQKEYRGATAATLSKRPKSLKAIKGLLK